MTDSEAQAAYNATYSEFARGYILAYELAGYLTQKGVEQSRIPGLIYAYFADCVHRQPEHGQMPFDEWFVE